MAKCCYYQFFPRATALVLVMSGLLYAAHWFLYAAIGLSLPGKFGRALVYVHVASWILVPVTGWVAQSWLGRYRAIVVGLVLTVVTILTTQAVCVMLQFDWTPIPVFALIAAGMIVSTLGIGSIMLPFALDQMIGASAEQLGAAVHWYSWGVAAGYLFKTILQLVPIPNLLQPWQFRQTVSLAIGTLCFSAVLIMDCLYHKRLDTNNKTGNPIKLIFQVLNYARKNKCPRLRSALTYIDEEHPSRLDFGKHKFGGPFTEEEVEDVKTIFRLMPLIMLACGILFCELSISHNFAKKAFKWLNTSYILNIDAMCFILIPVYRFIVYPLARKHLPSLLKMIGAGLILLLVSTIINITATATVYFSRSHNITMSDQVSLYLRPLIEIFNGLGAVVTAIFFFEFVIAQTPNRMRGIMIGILLFTGGWCTIGSRLFTRILNKFIPQSIMFYFYLTLPPLTMLVLITLFVIVAKRYKLRERERHVNIQAIVEEHYERYFDQEEEYMREEQETISIRS